MAQYVVKQGDSWESIAGKIYNDQRQFAHLASANNWNGGKVLQPGQVINLPSAHPDPVVTQADIDRTNSINAQVGYSGAMSGGTMAPSIAPAQAPVVPTSGDIPMKEGSVAPGATTAGIAGAGATNRIEPTGLPLAVPTGPDITLGVAGAGAGNMLPASVVENPQPVATTKATSVPGAVSGAEPKAGGLYEPPAPVIMPRTGQVKPADWPKDPTTGQDALYVDKNGQPVYTPPPAAGSGLPAQLWHDVTETARQYLALANAPLQPAGRTSAIPMEEAQRLAEIASQPGVVAYRLADLMRQSDNPVRDLLDGSLFGKYKDTFGDSVAAPISAAMRTAVGTPGNILNWLHLQDNPIVQRFTRGLSELAFGLQQVPVVTERIEGTLGPIGHDLAHLNAPQLIQDLSSKNIEASYVSSRLAYTFAGDEALYRNFIKRWESGQDPQVLAAEMENPTKEFAGRAVLDPLNFVNPFEVLDDISKVTPWVRPSQAILDGIDLVRNGAVDEGYAMAKDAIRQRAGYAADYVTREGRTFGMFHPLASSKRALADRVTQAVISRVVTDSGDAAPAMQTLLDMAVVHNPLSEETAVADAFGRLASHPAANTIFGSDGTIVGQQLGDLLTEASGKAITYEGEPGAFWIRQALEDSGGNPNRFMELMGPKLEQDTRRMYPGLTDRVGNPDEVARLEAAGKRVPDELRGYQGQIDALRAAGKPVPAWLARYDGEQIPEWMANAVRLNNTIHGVTGPVQRWMSRIWLGWSMAFGSRAYIADNLAQIIEEPSALMRLGKDNKNFVTEILGYTPEWAQRGHGSPIGNILAESGNRESLLDKTLIGQRFANWGERGVADRLGSKMVEDTMAKGIDAGFRDVGPVMKAAGYTDEQISALQSLIVENRYNLDKALEKWTSSGVPSLPLSLNPRDYAVLRQFQGIHDELIDAMKDPANFRQAADDIMKSHGVEVEKAAAEPAILPENAPEAKYVAQAGMKDAPEAVAMDDFFTKKINDSRHSLDAYQLAQADLAQEMGRLTSNDPQAFEALKSIRGNTQSEVAARRTQEWAEADSVLAKAQADTKAAYAKGGGGAKTAKQVWDTYRTPGMGRDAVHVSARNDIINSYEAGWVQMREVNPDVANLIDNSAEIQNARALAAQAKAWDNVDVPLFKQSGLAYDAQVGASARDVFNELHLPTLAPADAKGINKPFSTDSLVKQANSHLPEGVQPFTNEEIKATALSPQRTEELRQALVLRQAARSEQLNPVAEGMVRVYQGNVPGEAPSIAKPYFENPAEALGNGGEHANLVYRDVPQDVWQAHPDGMLPPEFAGPQAAGATQAPHPVDVTNVPSEGAAPGETPPEIAKPLISDPTAGPMSMNKAYAANEEGLRDFVGRLADNVEARFKAGAGTTIPASAPEDVVSRLRNYLSDMKYQANAVANEARNRILIDYPKKYGFDAVLQNFIPFEFFNTRGALRLARQMVEHPGYLAGYMEYRDAMAKLHSNLPDWWKNNMSTDLLGINVDSPLYFNLEAILNPVYRMTEAAQGTGYMDPNKGISWFGRALNGMNTYGFSPIILAEWALAAYDYATGNPELRKEAEAYLGGRLIPASQPIKSITHLLGITAPTGKSPIVGPAGVEIDPYVLIRGAEGSIYEMNRVGRVLGDMVMNKEVSQEQATDAARLQSGPIWDAAVSRAASDRDWSNVLAGTLGLGFKYRSPQEMQIDQAQQAESMLYLMKPEMSPATYSQKWQELYQQYPWLTALHLARKQGDDAEEAYIWDVYSRLPPGRASKPVQDMIKAAGLSPALLDKWYSTKGDLSQFSKTDRDALIAGIDILGANLASPPMMVQQDWDAVRNEYKAVVGDPTEDVSNKWDIYRNIPTANYDEKRAYLQNNPDLADWFDRRERAIMNDPLLQKYYGGLDWLNGVWSGRMYDHATKLFGEDIFVKERAFYAIRDAGGDTRSFLAQHPELNDYWDYLHIQKPLIEQRIADAKKWLPATPSAFIRPDAAKDSVVAQAALKGLSSSAPAMDTATSMAEPYLMPLHAAGSSSGPSLNETLDIEAEKTWPGVVLKEQLFTQMAQQSKEAAANYLAQNPDLQQERLWRKARTKEYNSALKLQGRAVPQAASWQTWKQTVDPSNEGVVPRLLVDYFRSGAMNDDLQKRLQTVWVASGRPGGSLVSWIEMMKGTWKASGATY